MSQPDWRRQAALAAILCVLGTFAFWLEFKHKPQQEEREEQGKKPLALEKNQVQSIRINNGSRELQLECVDYAAKLCRTGDNSKWQLKAPIRSKADDNNSNSLISSLSGLTVSDTIGLKEETPEKRAALLKDYGLDTASLAHDRQVELVTSNGTSVLYLGQTHPIGDGIFAAIEKVSAGQKASGKIDDTQVYVLPSYIKTTFEHDLTYWRDKKVLPIAAHEIESFILKNSKGEIRGERKNGVWTLHSKNDEVQGDLEQMDALLSGATSLTAKDFASDDHKDGKARAALAGARQVVTFSIKKEKTDAPIIVTFYEKPNGKPLAKGVVQNRLFVSVSGLDPLFEVESFGKERLNKSLEELRQSKLITSMDRFGAKRLELAGVGYEKPWVLLNKDSKWIVEGTPSETINAEKIQNFLDRLTSNRIQSFVTKDLPRESSTLQLTLGDDSQPQKRKLLFWRDTGKLGQKLYARDLLSKRNEVFLMDNSLTSELPWDKAKFK